MGLRKEINAQCILEHISHQLPAWARGLQKQTTVYKGVDKFVYDPSISSFYFTRATRRDIIEFTFRGADPRHDSTAIDMAPCRIVSLNLSPSRILLATSLGSRYSGLTLTRLPEPDDFYSVFHTMALGLPIQEHPVSQATQKLFLPDTTFWQSSPKPHPSGSEFAIAAGSRVMRTFLCDGWDWDIAAGYSSPDQSDALALDWLDTNVVLCGHRKGKVILWDTRASGTHARSPPIQHSASVAHVRRLSQSKIVIAGLEDQLSIYDLRFPTLNHPSSSPSRTSTPADQDQDTEDGQPPASSEPASKPPKPTPTPTPKTTPYLTLPHYLNRTHPGHILGFDVSPDANLIAAASDRPSTGNPSEWTYMPGARAHDLPCSHYIPAGEAVQVWDASSGKKLDIGPSGLGAERDEEDRARAKIARAREWGDGWQNGVHDGGDGEGEGTHGPDWGERQNDYERLGILVTCLKFVEGERKGWSLMVGSDFGIEEWCW